MRKLLQSRDGRTDLALFLMAGGLWIASLLIVLKFSGIAALAVN